MSRRRSAGRARSAKARLDRARLVISADEGGLPVMLGVRSVREVVGGECVSAQVQQKQGRR